MLAKSSNIFGFIMGIIRKIDKSQRASEDVFTCFSQSYNMVLGLAKPKETFNGTLRSEFVAMQRIF